MKTTTPQLALHLAQENTTLARLLKIARLDGVVLRFTDFDTDLTYDDGSGLPSIVTAWAPKPSLTTPYWLVTNDTLAHADAAPTNYYPAIAPWSASQIFSGNGGTSANFLGTTSYINNFTFSAIVSLHADTLNHAGIGAIGGARVGLGNDFGWSGPDKYIGFEGKKASGADWGNWMLRMSDGTNVTLIDSGVKVADVIDPDGFPTNSGGIRTKLSFTVNADGSLITWYINDVPVGGAVVNLPTVGMSLTTHWESLAVTGSIYYRVESVQVLVPSSTIGTYFSGDGVTFTALTSKDDGSPNNMQVTGFLADAGVSAEDIRSRLYDGATFEYRIVNWMDLSMREVKMLAGTIGDYEMKNGIFTVQLRGLTQKLTTVVGSLYGPLCRAELFGGGAEGIDPTNHWKCRLNRADWVQNGEVQVSTDSITIVPFNTPSVSSLVMRGSATPFAPAPAGWFDNGVIIFTSGVLNGYKFEIATWDGNALVLFGGGPMPQSPAPGDTFQIEPGCDKRKDTCFSKFNNVINHAGEADIPGLNVIGAVSRTQVPTS